MNMKWCIAALAVLALSTSIASGAVISRDWKTPGDGLLTYDTVSGREWLDLSETQLTLFPGETRNDRYLAVVAETGAGGLFDGFWPASKEDVFGLAASAGIDTSASRRGANNEAAGVLAELASLTKESQRGRWTSGLVHDLDRNRTVVLIGFNNQDREFSGVIERNVIGMSHGVWMYRTVPEPPAIVLALLLSSLGLLAAWRRVRVPGAA